MGNDSIIAKNLTAAVAELTARATHVHLLKRTVGDMLVRQEERSDPAFHASHRLYLIMPDENNVPTIWFTLLVEYRLKSNVEVTFNWLREEDGLRFADLLPDEWFTIAPVRDAEWRQRCAPHPAAIERRRRREARAAAKTARGAV